MANFANAQAREGDTDATVRDQILHTLCDGSPTHLEDTVVDCIKEFTGDEDKHVRRRANKVLGCYKATGKWNIL